MSAAAARLTQIHGEPKSTLAGPAHARGGTSVDHCLAGQAWTGSLT
jgi:hypothetical protein